MQVVKCDRNVQFAIDWGSRRQLPLDILNLVYEYNGKWSSLAITQFNGHIPNGSWIQMRGEMTLFCDYNHTITLSCDYAQVRYRDHIWTTRMKLVQGTARCFLFYDDEYLPSLRQVKSVVNITVVYCHETIQGIPGILYLKNKKKTTLGFVFTIASTSVQDESWITIVFHW